MLDIYTLPHLQSYTNTIQLYTYFTSLQFETFICQPIDTHTNSQQYSSYIYGVYNNLNFHIILCSSIYPLSYTSTLYSSYAKTCCYTTHFRQSKPIFNPCLFEFNLWNPIIVLHHSHLYVYLHIWGIIFFLYFDYM